MSRRLHLLWIPLLAALLGGPMGQRPPVRAPGSVAENTEREPGVGRLVSATRLQLARPVAAPTERHGGPSSPGLPTMASTAVVTVLRYVIPPALASPLAETARHFPLFPTGPPSHG